MGGFSGVPSFVLVRSVSLVSWPFFAGSLHVVVSLSRRLLLPRSVPCVAWAHLASQKLRSKGAVQGVAELARPDAREVRASGADFVRADPKRALHVREFV